MLVLLLPSPPLLFLSFLPILPIPVFVLVLFLLLLFFLEFLLLIIPPCIYRFYISYHHSVVSNFKYFFDDVSAVLSAQLTLIRRLLLNDLHRNVLCFTLPLFFISPPLLLLSPYSFLFFQPLPLLLHLFSLLHLVHLLHLHHVHLLHLLLLEDNSGICWRWGRRSSPLLSAWSQ